MLGDMLRRAYRKIPFSFPNPVDEVSARLVATGVVAMGISFLVTRLTAILVVMAYGFGARLLFGPRFSPLGRMVTTVVRPRLSRTAKLVAGSPKRFAQGIGLVFSVGALISVVLGAATVALVLIAGLVVAASLEAFVGFCLGCWAFRKLMRVGLIPASVCQDCNDVTERLKVLIARQSSAAVSSTAGSATAGSSAAASSTAMSSTTLAA